MIGTTVRGVFYGHHLINSFPPQNQKHFENPSFQAVPKPFPYSRPLSMLRRSAAAGAFAANLSPLPFLRRIHHSPQIAMAQSSVPTIGTHDGAFHCDEALACHMLRQVPRFQTSSITRTRDTQRLAALDIVVDVGAEYNPDKLRFDHHQRGFSSTFASSGLRSRTKLSSAGLVYKHFGRDVVAAVLKKAGLTVAEEDVERVYLHVYDSFVEEVDAIDNGIERFESNKPARYHASTSLSSRVARLNADWFEKEPDQDANFQKAVALTGSELDDAILRTARGWLPARAIVAKAMETREEGGKLLILREWAPWKDHLYELEKVFGGEVAYVVYQDMTGRSWRVQCVPVEKGSFQSRRPLPELWRGLRDAELSKVIGIDKCIFVHAAGFIGGNQEFEGAMQMARKALA